MTNCPTSSLRTSAPAGRATCVRALTLAVAVATAGTPTVGLAGRRTRTRDNDVRALMIQWQRRGESKAEIHLAVAGFLAKRGDPRAHAHLKAARSMGIHPMRLRLVKSVALRREGRFEDAFATLLHILVKHPDQPYALVQLWKTAYETLLRGAASRVDLDSVRGRLSDFGMHLPAKLSLSKKATQQSGRLTTLGYNAMLAGRLRYAAELFEAAIDRLPSNARAHRGLGLTRTAQHDHLRAAGAMLVYLELDPSAEDANDVDRKLITYWKKRHQ